MLDFIKELALAAGEIIKQGYYKEKIETEHKGSVDLVTEIDLASEKYIIARIRERFPTDSILAEEKPDLTSSGRVWIIDPLDGTTNFAHKFPNFAVSIGLEIEGTIQFGVVYQPITDELFWAERDKGAFLNGKKIQVSGTPELSQSLIGTGFPYDRWEHAEAYAKDFTKVMRSCQGIRRAGAAAIDLCYLACGRLDGFFEQKLKPWDLAAGTLIIAEAGGKLTGYDGRAWDFYQSKTVASNGLIHEELQSQLLTCHPE